MALKCRSSDLVFSWDLDECERSVRNAIDVGYRLN
jgi:hypothetical protein